MAVRPARAALRELGCDLAQGWQYGAAEPVEVLLHRLAELPPAGGARVVRLGAQRGTTLAVPVLDRVHARARG